MDIINVDYREKIPNNVNLTEDRRVLKALEGWHPGYINWWNDMGPEGFQESLVYLRTAVSVDPKGWAKFDYVKMPQYRWGILLAPHEENRKIGFGEHLGEPPSYSEYLSRGMRLLDSPLSGNLNNILGQPGQSLSGYDQRDAGGFSAPNRVMYAQSHDNAYANVPSSGTATIYPRRRRE